MTTMWLLLAVGAAAAVVDWIAVATTDRRLEYLAKPAVMVALIAAAALIPDGSTDLADRRQWFIWALVLCLVGDVCLMAPQDLFIPGLAAFLGGHVLFIVGLLQGPEPPGTPPFDFSATGLVVAAVVVVGVEAVPGAMVLRSLTSSGQASLIGPVCAYVAAIVTMVVLAVNVGVGLAALGAVAFLASDTLLAVDRFVHPLPSGKLAVHVTYHCAQILLVSSLLR
jgi:alkenylglycerophosphocholine/alkenylglycerophosphoethanolamine hydrolase